MRVTTSTGRHPTRTRAGFTLIELMITLVILSVIGGAMIKLLNGQQRFYNGTADLIELRSQLRQGGALLSGDLRALSPANGDITAISDSSIDIRRTIGSAIACASPAGSTSLIIPPLGMSNTLTAFSPQPQGTGDIASVFDEGPNTVSSTDDTWREYTIAIVTPNAGTCAGAYNAGGSGLTVGLTANMSATILGGAPVRFLRPEHFSLYQASDNLWYLGYCSPACAAGNPISAVAGPFNAYDSNVGAGTSGIRFTYYDANGNTTTDRTQVARISVVLRGQTRGALNITGMKKGVYTDSVRVDVAVRNRT